MNDATKDLSACRWGGLFFHSRLTMKKPEVMRPHSSVLEGFPLRPLESCK